MREALTVVVAIVAMIGIGTLISWWDRRQYHRQVDRAMGSRFLEERDRRRWE